jgi:hypothetical protein
MASERQIAANQRNARNSTGPRSSSGKRRARQNAFRHGLTKSISRTEFDQEVETLGRQVAGDSHDRITLELARDAAEAVLELARVRRVKVALIEGVTAFGPFDVPSAFQSANDEVAWIMKNCVGATRLKARPKFAVDPLAAIASQEPQRTAEAMRRMLPDLVKLQRYESRAVARRDRAIRAIALTGKVK